jgi:hypothetical protein
VIRAAMMIVVESVLAAKIDGKIMIIFLECQIFFLRDGVCSVLGSTIDL